MSIYITQKIQYLKGVGSAKAKALNGMGIFSIEDLLTDYPRRYEDHSQRLKIGDIKRDAEFVSVEGVIANIAESKPRRNMSILKVVIGDGSGYMQLVWFNQPFLKKKFRIGMRLLATGKVNRQSRYLSISGQIEYEVLDGAENQESVLAAILPVYNLTDSINQKFMRGLVRLALDDIDKVSENMPEQILGKYKLLKRDEALRKIHFPDSKADFTAARQRLAFEELYFIQCGLAVLKQRNSTQQRGIKHLMDSTLLRKVMAAIPFKLTNDQKKAWQEIKFDMERSIPMQRLLQGDVGSGKTIIAILALTKTVENGYQGALMAPTEILAEQHYESLTRLLEQFDIKIALLTGKLTKKERTDVLTTAAAGKVDIVIGTHALIQEEVEFKQLGLVVTDEQHRFGVRQCGMLQEKGDCPDVLVMTATPIPRTMTLTVYGDLDVSLIRELPPGRKPIRTFVRMPDRRGLIYKFVVDEIAKGRQAYVVCPLIEASENVEAVSATDIYEELQSGFFKHVKCGLIHGKLNNREKEAIMEQFHAGQLKLLVATTVIEVGVNVPNASVMVVEGADRFGLAQLHQLRGRIGRGEYQSYCILLSKSKTEKTQERLQIMEKTNDGFVLAEEDLRLRGPGQFFGLRQHGLPDLKIADILNDIDILMQAREAAMETINDPSRRSQVLDYLAVKYREHFGNFKQN